MDGYFFIMKKIRNSLTEITVAYRPKKTIVELPKITSSIDAAFYLIGGFDPKTIGMQEQFVVLYLNQANHILGLYRASVGGITGTVADIRIILSIGLKVLATAIIVGHNHPSGNLKPSNCDEKLTRKLKESAKLMDIKLLDHLIITPSHQYYSFADDGLL